MKSFSCDCRDLGSSFTFCATHALSPDKREIDNFWMGMYRPADWYKYKEALIVGLKLEGLKTHDESHPGMQEHRPLRR